jgi:UDP-N-acetylmuramoyl-L-alanyl-D-glutamate--2,6-diaminopimelate ligase
MVRKQSESQSKIWTIFGCGGDRDKGKRPLMAKAAAAFSDFVMITSDNPRSENPDEIIKDIMAGIENPGKERIFSEVSRRIAIEKVIARARPHDVILIAGKGHEDYQIVGDQKLNFSDFEVAKEILL